MKSPSSSSPLVRSVRARPGALLLLAGLGALAVLRPPLQPVEAQESFPLYMQSPLQPQPVQESQPDAGAGTAAPSNLSQRSNIPLAPPQPAPAGLVELVPQPSVVQPPPPPPRPSSAAGCLYDKRHFARFDQCLERKPYPTIGLPAFRNDDLLAARNGLADKHGCSFVLTNGLFKHYQISKYAVDSDTKCLDDDKLVRLSLQFSNVTLYYLWQLRCLNYANQLLDDATLDGNTASVEQAAGEHQKPASEAVCVGSSQNFGFSSLQLTNIEAQLELAMDIYKNWRVTNITLAMLPNGAANGKQEEWAPGAYEHAPAAKSTGLRDFTFETLDGDELNWRFLNLYENWTRNRLHTNFLDQFRRFVWISLQRCLSEASEKLPVKLVELFGEQRYN